jgi:formamidopyrimidine-DNA glycosylase
MPELPDVEGFRRVLADNAVRKRIAAVEVPDRDLLRNASPQALGRALTGKRFREPVRHGKWLIAPAGEAHVLMHFGMTGSLEWEPRGPRHAHDRVAFLYRHAELRFRDMRKFGGIWLANDEEECHAITGPLGPDAVTLGREQLHELLGSRRGAIKAALMDQRLVAGLGNLLVDEILWRARLDPHAPAARLSSRRRDAIYDAMRETLRASIRTRRVPRASGWLTEVRDRRGARCPRCGTRLRSATVAGRSTRWCPRCQRTAR